MRKAATWLPAISLDDCVYCNDEEVGYLAARHLIETGHRKVAMLSHRQVVFSSRKRFTGFRQACLDAGIPEEDIGYACLQDPDEILAQLKAWIAAGFNGLFSFCDVEAWAEITLLDRIGIGFDNILGYINFTKPLCSVDCHLQDEARIAIELIRNRIHDPSLPPQQVIIPVDFVSRCR